MENSLSLMYLNVSDFVSMKEPTYTKVYNELANQLSDQIMSGRLDVTKEHTLFVCTKFGAATVTLIPKTRHQ